ncbi:hypothetical protein BVY04_04795, partial [bacterium M21]
PKPHQEAIKSYAKAVELNPQYPIAHHNWGLALLRMKQPAQALEHFRIAAGQSNEPETIYLMGIAFQDAGKADKAVLCFKKVLEICPTHAESQARLKAIH